ncbi:nicotinamide N-methyltransferase [Coniella lustricola]|uniref:Nicotinamide N-methyltransferase n=1 Tax=Coniella lustricola TaxID=2025994 RepID=A0A2T3ALK8_9PEZI|nr:nicotinamide N-methyltransferase [Coniella lustricola]
MSLALRLTPAAGPTEDPEDFFGDSLGVVFQDDTLNLHGDANHALHYTSPHLPKPLHISLADPEGDKDRELFSHYLWNASLLLAEFVEAGTLAAEPNLESALGPPLTDFDISDLATIELGAGAALPSLLATLLGARRVVMTDYPAPAVISNLRANAQRNVKSEFSPLGKIAEDVLVEGHAWGELSSSSSSSSEINHHAFDRVMICDCLWMPWQHANLLASIDWFLKTKEESPDARCWCVAGFHSGRWAMREFFRREKLRAVGLEVERIWERDCDGVEREWVWDRGNEDPGERKRWLTFVVLRRETEKGGMSVGEVEMAGEASGEEKKE